MTFTNLSIPIIKSYFLQTPQDYIRKFDAERTAYETQIIQLQQTIMENERQIKDLLIEIEKHSHLTEKNSREVETWRRKISLVEESHSREVLELKSQIDQLKSSGYVRPIRLFCWLLC